MYATVATVYGVRVLVANVGANSNRTCVTCPTVVMGGRLLLGHHSNNRTTATDRLPITIEDYGPLLQIYWSSVSTIPYKLTLLGEVANNLTVSTAVMTLSEIRTTVKRDFSLHCQRSGQDVLL
jgi:hypothetical protein